MKPLQELRDTISRLARRLRGARRPHRKRTCVKPSPNPREPPSAASTLKIEVVRDICTQPAPGPDAAASSPPSFPQFMALPLEIRLLIWHAASTTGRVVELQWSHLELGFRNRAAPRPPAVLHACHESRGAALKVFQPYFAMRARRPPIYVDPVHDVLFFRLPPGYYAWRWMSEWMRSRDRPARAALLRQELRGIRRVAFLARDVEYNNSPFSARPERLLPDLEEFIVLWADWALRSFEGRGFNLIEGVSPCVNHTHTSVSQQVKPLKHWEAHFRNRERGAKMPVISLRHWCVREEE